MDQTNSVDSGVSVRERAHSFRLIQFQILQQTPLGSTMFRLRVAYLDEIGLGHIHHGF